jgi:ubiquinone/menaquinone biosynthesis C-methylase UbiE
MNWLPRACLITGVLLSTAGFMQGSGPNPEQDEKGRDTYLGRRIARTMHWTGAEWLMRETREKEENSSVLMQQFQLQEGDRACDLGCGNGYYTLPMARMVGETGQVLAVDIQPQMLNLLEARLSAAGLENVVPILGTIDDPKLPPASCDLVVLIDVYHELSHPVAVLSHIRKALKPDGELMLVEFRLEDPTVPIKLVHKMSKAQVLTEMSANGFRLTREFDELPWQHVMVFGADADFPRAEGQKQAEGEAIAAGIVRAWIKGDLVSLAGFGEDTIQITSDSQIRSMRHKSWLDRHIKRLEELGQESWSKEHAGWTSKTAPAEEGLWKSAAKGDLALKIAGPQSSIEFLLRCNSDGQWRIIHERANR